MIRNYYTLLHLCREINNLSGFAVKDCWTQEKDTLIIEYSDGKSSKYMIFRTDGKNDSVYIKNEFARAGKNTMSLLHELTDELFQSCEIVEKERVIKIRFINTIAYIVLFGGEKGNLFVTNHDDTIIDCFKNSKEYLGTKFSLEARFLPSLNDFSTDTPIRKVVGGSDYLFGSYYADEILAISQINPDKVFGDLTAEEIDVLHENCDRFRDKLIYDPEYLVYHDEENFLLSLSQLSTLELIKKFDTISEAIGFTISKNFKLRSFDSLANEIKKSLDFILKRQINHLEKIQNQEKVIKQYEEYKKIGDLLMSHPLASTTHGKSIEIEDYNGKVYVIKLDPKLKLTKNAGFYYKKMRIAENEIKIRENRIPEVTAQIEEIKQAIAEFEPISNIKSLEQFKEKYKHLLRTKMQDIKKAPEEKYRRFELTEGFVVFVGKSAANNDELTMKLAKPNDIWLHARGTSGSHVVLKMHTNDKPPKYILEQAAQIAAYYSGARNAKHVPVIYTYKKYVRKPKGANPGAVVVNKEDVIIVEPKLPNQG
jgi:predicted ribosome quality control (RQC) complex YloA/Tae2 family protein